MEFTSEKRAAMQTIHRSSETISVPTRQATLDWRTRWESHPMATADTATTETSSVDSQPPSGMSFLATEEEWNRERAGLSATISEPTRRGWRPFRMSMASWVAKSLAVQNRAPET